MSRRMFTVFCLICMMVNGVACSQTWTVNYLHKEKCALKGSTTLLSGSFTNLDNLNLTDVFWTVNPVKVFDPPDLSKDPEYKGRVEYIMSKDQTFILKLSNVTHEDEKMYCVSIVTEERKKKYLGFPGIDLKVTELRVEVHREVLEGNSFIEEEKVILFCRSSCNFPSNTEYRWYKNKIPLSDSFSRNKMFLHLISREDAGEFSCAVRQHEDLISPAVTLSVTSPPTNVSENRLNVIPVVVISVVVMMSIILVVVIVMFIRRKRVTSSEENNRCDRHQNDVVTIEAEYMTLDPTSRCADYDTLHNVKMSSDHARNSEAQDPTYYNVDI